MPQPSKSLYIASSVTVHERLPRKTDSDGSFSGKPPPDAPSARGLRGVAISTFIGRPSTSLPFREEQAACASAAEPIVAKTAPFHLPVSACISQSMFVIEPADWNSSFIHSSVILNERLPMKMRLPSSAAGVVGAAGEAGVVIGSAVPSLAAFFAAFFAAFSSLLSLTFSPSSDFCFFAGDAMSSDSSAARLAALASFFAFFAAFSSFESFGLSSDLPMVSCK